MSEKPIQDILYCRIATNTRRHCGSKSNKNNKNFSNEKVNISSSICNHNKKVKHNYIPEQQQQQQCVKSKRSKVNIEPNVNRTKAHTSSDVRKKCPTITINILHNKSNTTNNNSNSNNSRVNKGRGKSHNVLSRSINMVDVVDSLSCHCNDKCNGSSLVISQKKQCSPSKYYNCSYYFNRLVINPMSFIHHRPPTVCVTLF